MTSSGSDEELAGAKCPVSLDDHKARAIPSSPRTMHSRGGHHPSFTSTTTTGLRVMAQPLPAPTVPSAKAPPQCSPPSAENLCLKTFCSCWFLNRDWLISFVASTQRAKPDAPVTWVKFMPKGHTHLVRSALKLVPVSKHLLLAKIKEVMFTFLLETLNAPGSSPGFFNARKAAKPHKRTRKRKSGEKQSADSMAVDAPLPDPNPPPPSTGNPSGSTPVSDTGTRNEGDKGEVPPGPSSEAPGTRGNDPVTPHPFSLPDPAAPPPKSAEEAMEAAIALCEACATWRSQASTCAPSPSPSVTLVLGKCSFPPPSTSPLPPVGSPVPHALQDWHAWMEWIRVIYSDRNPGRPVPAVVTLLDLCEAASAASPTPILSPPPFFRSPLPPSPPLPPFCRRPLVERRGSFANLRPRRPIPTFV